MREVKLTAEEIAERRKKFFKEMNEDYPHVPILVATNSGVVEPLPETQEGWDNFHTNLQFVDGVARVR